MATRYVFASQLKELRFLFCQTGEHSAAVRFVQPSLSSDQTDSLPRRTFLQKSYPTMKKHNPHTPILIREALGIEPKVFARYGAWVDGVLPIS